MKREKDPTKNVTLALLLSLCLALSPLTAFADERDAADPSEENLPLVLEESEPDEQEPAPDAPEEVLPGSPDAEEGAGQEESTGEMPASSDVLEEQAAPDTTVSFSPRKNTTMVDVNLPGLAGILEQSYADALTVKATISYAGTTTRSVEKQVSLADVDQTTGSFEMDFGTFAKFSVTATFTKGGKTVGKPFTTTVGVIADEYNIAPLTATMPVTIFSLSLWGDGNIRTAGPTIVLLQRAVAYDWDALPAAGDGLYGVYGLPYVTDSELRVQHDDPHRYFLNTQAPIVAAYIHDLYEISPDSTFNFFFGDNFVFLMQTCIYANKIPEDQYNVNILSDGTGSYTSTFSNHYGGSDPASDHAARVSEWNAAKSYAYANGKPKAGFDNNSYSNCLKYTWPAIDSDPKATWWLTRPSLLSTAGDGNAFGSSVAASPKIKTFNIGNALTSLQNAGDGAVAQFKALYKFNDDYFAEANAKGKSPMVFLGTRVNLEANFSEYARFIMEYYGDEYVYYYKGHPATPTEMYPNKESQLKALGVTDVNASVAAELILFFNPEIYLSGYASSTYSSVPKGMGKGMFNMTKEAGLANELYRNMDFWITPVGDGTPKKAVDLCTKGHDNFLVEFSDEVAAAEGYDIAIWDATDSRIIYYKLADDGSYTKTGVSGSGVKGDMSLAEGVYYIQSELKNNMMLEVSGASHKSAANVHIWQYKGGTHQQWRLSYDDEGMATLTNVESGLVLDVTGARGVRGTNIDQQASNESAAQKWNVKRNDDDTYTLYAAVGNGLAADVSGAKTKNGTNVLLWTGSAAKNQKWRFIPLDPGVTTDGMEDIEEGCYTLAPKVAPTLRLDVSSNSTSNGGNLIIWNDTGAANQTFRITKQESGFYCIENAFSGKVVDVSGGAYVSGTNVLQWDDKGGTNQQWAIYKMIDGAYTLRNVGTGLMLDVAGAGKKAGTNVDAYRSTGAVAQRWSLTKVDDPAREATEYLANHGRAIKRGRYTIRMAANKSIAFDVSKASKKANANVALYKYHGKANQRWNVLYDADGYAMLINANSGMALTYKKNVAGANVCQDTLSGELNQKWVVKDNGDDTLSLMPALGTGLVLGTKGGKTTSGTNVQLVSAKSSSGTKFSFASI